MLLCIKICWKKHSHLDSLRKVSFAQNTSPTNTSSNWNWHISTTNPISVFILCTAWKATIEFSYMLINTFFWRDVVSLMEYVIKLMNRKSDFISFIFFIWVFSAKWRFWSVTLDWSLAKLFWNPKFLMETPLF